MFFDFCIRLSTSQTDMWSLTLSRPPKTTQPTARNTNFSSAFRVAYTFDVEHCDMVKHVYPTGITT